MSSAPITRSPKPISPQLFADAAGSDVAPRAAAAPPSRWSGPSRPGMATTPATWRCSWPSRSSAIRARSRRRWSARCRASPVAGEGRDRRRRLHQSVPDARGQARRDRAGARAQGSITATVAIGQGKKVQVEFVSANPTGPLHVGHGRGAAYGASLANVLEAAGFDVTREYYVNDAGRQMDILALVHLAALPGAAGRERRVSAQRLSGRLRARHGRGHRAPRTASATCAQPSALPTALPPLEADAEAHLDALDRQRQDSCSGRTTPTCTTTR